MRCSFGVPASSKDVAVAANFLHRDADENFAPACVCRSVSRLLLGHGFGPIRRPAARRSSASATHPSRSTPDLSGTPDFTPPYGLRFPSKSCSESTPKRFLRTLRKCRASALGSMAHSLNGDPIKFGKFNKRRHDHVPEQSQPHRLSRQ